ncbi:hypothetical protein M3P36_05275 [Altererythrobacter sp. KTW20L]|uniref:hypothetical protein n=1 Tax=Altererythrobacter sp. KTW20L TaxID=2942210 RepID=UPI0020C13E49|nr:hypothetical protein [Altererythrobacter sp. KTW20L]MCL6250456.1 hypothetical protein [Altererythrobacter sp. KTW20L]
MKQMIISTALAIGLAASPAFAQSAPHQHAPAPAESSQIDQGTTMKMGSEGMQQHRQSMEEMRALMQRAHAATDPAERQRLMGEHRQLMQERMANMREGGHAMMQSCQDHMAMMHDIMGQMAAHHEMMPSS